MEILNIQAVITALALSVVVQYLTDKTKYILPNVENDKLYSIVVALIALIYSVIITYAFNVSMFNGDIEIINKILTAAFLAGGSSAINELVSTLQNIKNKDSE